MKYLKIMMISCLSMMSFTMKSQSINTFDVIENGNVQESEIPKYKAAILSSNMESYRNKSTRDTLSFDNGLKFVLYSAQELYILGYVISPNDYDSYRDPKYTNPIFYLSDTGYLIALYNHIEK